ncbi:MAG: hypothetical protein QXM98_01665 [Thermoproteota archaeon]|nr:hypothetical protein [Candidatus Brockarchaeota archaeon]
MGELVKAQFFHARHASKPALTLHREAVNPSLRLALSLPRKKTHKNPF